MLFFIMQSLMASASEDSFARMGPIFLEQALQTGKHFFEIKLIRHTYFPQKPFLAEDP